MTHNDYAQRRAPLARPLEHFVSCCVTNKLLTVLIISILTGLLATVLIEIPIEFASLLLL